MRKCRIEPRVSRGLVDFHSHILPEMDDGASSAEESVAMANLSLEAGISSVVATPHFYADRGNPDSFLARRQKALEKMLSAPGFPAGFTVYTGAEVAYYRGIGMSEAALGLTVTGTSLLLLEMPFEHWSKGVIDDVLQMQSRLGIRPILAHMERYLPFHNRDALALFSEQDILMQTNQSFCTGRRALRMWKNGELHLMGSDCHNTDTRAPGFSDALNYLCRKCDASFFEALRERSCTVLQGAVAYQKK